MLDWILFARKKSRGQTLMEVVVGIAVGSIFVVGTVYALSSLLISNATNRKVQTATDLAGELMDNVRAESDANWKDIYSLTHASSTHYYINTASSPFLTSSGNEVVTVNGVPFTRYFYVDNVSRDNCATGSVTTTAVTACTFGPGTDGVGDDPSTQKISVTITWPGAPLGLTTSAYITRSQNQAFLQNDWSGGSGQEMFATTTDGTTVNSLFLSSNTLTFSTAGALTITSGTSGDLTSSVYDTFRVGGAGLNSIMWQGSLGTGGGAVKFQIAASNGAGGSWSYQGIDGTSGTYYTTTGPDSAVGIRKDQNNKRYVRYKVFLTDTSATPTVNDIILNWSK